jgi:D-alanyl-D-alanine carboxypeptidase
MIIKSKIFLIIAALIASLPTLVVALDMPGSVAGVSVVQVDSQDDGISAQAYLVLNASTGQVLAQKNADAPRVPASLTKLVTALVFLDTNPNLNKIVTMQKSDQNGGGCTAGGACISTKPGVAYRLNDLFHASLIASANNATMAEARSTGLAPDEFVRRMNEKVQSLGATQSHFVEPTGMDPANVTTAADYAKIVQAAFANPLIQNAAQSSSYSFRSTNNKQYSHKLKNTDKLLGDDRLTVIGAKTGYLNESQYNFATEVKDQLDNDLVVVLFGSRSGATEFAEARQLAALGTLALAFANAQQPAVLGTSTAASLIKF